MKPTNIKLLISIAALVSISFSLVGCMSTDVDEAEKAYLITIADLAAQGVAVGTPSQDGEKYVARRFINGLTEIEYEYDSENDPANSKVVLFYSEADFHRNETLAIKGFEDAIEAYLFGASLNSGDVEVVEAPKAFTLGEQNYSAILESSGGRWGNLVVTRKGKMVYSFLLAGPFVQYKATLSNLIGPKLDHYSD
jgi:hypothetical protein